MLVEHDAAAGSPIGDDVHGGPRKDASSDDPTEGEVGRDPNLVVAEVEGVVGVEVQDQTLTPAGPDLIGAHHTFKEGVDVESRTSAGRVQRFNDLLHRMVHRTGLSLGRRVHARGAGCQSLKRTAGRPN